MAENKQRFPYYPHVRGAYGMDINGQEFCSFTGLSDAEGKTEFAGIVKGDWSNNWVPDWSIVQGEGKKN